MDDGCAEIQIPAIGGDSTPLILFHDGGGTVFNYCLLGPLKRPVYGIANPHFDSGEPWNDGMNGMAQQYVRYIESTVFSGPILLGGWSMGGMLSLEVAHILSTHPRLQVKGIILIDSPYPRLTPPDAVAATTVAVSNPEFAPSTRQEVRDKILRSMKECRRLLASWELPDWPAGTAPPPAMMLRARDHTAPPGEAKLSHVDLARDDELLGWAQYPYDFIRESHTIPGAHFSVFISFRN